MAKVIAYDLDGTLCEGEAYTPEECLLAEPRWGEIKRLNDLSETEFVVVLTARRDRLIPASLQWLRRHNVKFHAISNNKMPADWYYDDKTTNTAKQLPSDDEPFP